MTTDETLALRAKAGNETAAELLFRRYQARIYSYLLRMLRDRLLAEDATQETFIRGLAGIKKYNDSGSFKSWIFKIAYREGLRVIEREKKHRWKADGNRLDGDDPPEPVDPSPLSGELLFNHERIQLLEKGLRKLTEEERQVVMLRFKQGLKFKEITDIMECSLNTTLGRMHNAVKKLKSFLAEEGETNDMQP